MSLFLLHSSVGSASQRNRRMSHLHHGGWAWGRLAATTRWVKSLPLVRHRRRKLPSIAHHPALGYLRCWTTRKRFGFQQRCFSVSTWPHRYKLLFLLSYCRVLYPQQTWVSLTLTFFWKIFPSFQLFLQNWSLMPNSCSVWIRLPLNRNCQSGTVCSLPENVQSRQQHIPAMEIVLPHCLYGFLFYPPAAFVNHIPCIQ